MLETKDPSFVCLTELLTNSGNEPGLVSDQDRYLAISKNTLYKVNGSSTWRVLYLVEVAKQYTCRDITTVLTLVPTKKPNKLTLSERD